MISLRRPRCNSITTAFRIASNAFTGRTMSISTAPLKRRGFWFVGAGGEQHP
jgi:hypothetical protein